ncbi:MAG: hypothetical protein J5845_05350 [Lachnospiraceae bacterium]|nr:hypothetical protein [Lachnospiraceae bacterium]
MGKSKRKRKWSRNRKVAAVIVGICVVAVAAWIVLMVSIFREDKPENKKQKQKADKGPWFVSEEYYTDSLGRTNRVFRCEYDSLGRLSRVIYDDERKGTYSYSYFYDEGMPITRVSYTTKKGTETTEYLPDGKKRIRVWDESSGNYTHTEVTQYDEKERPVCLTVEHGSSSTPYSKSETRYSYDVYGNITLQETQETVGDRTGEWIVQKNSIVDEAGRVTECNELVEGGQKNRRIMKVNYYDWGREEDTFISSIVKTDYADYTSTYSINKKYDTLGRVTQEAYSKSEFGETVHTKVYYEYAETDRGTYIKKNVVGKPDPYMRIEENTTLEQVFDNDGHVLLQRETVDEILEYSYVPEFDKNGRIVKTAEQYFGITPVDTVFNYDINGNLVSKENENEKYSYTYSKILISDAQARSKAEFYSYFPEELPGILYWKD